MKQLYWDASVDHTKYGRVGYTWRLRCPKCHNMFEFPTDPRKMWQGCPVCWTKLELREEDKKGKKK